MQRHNYEGKEFMSNPSNFGYNPDDFSDLADWDYGSCDYECQENGHISVYGRIDGEHYHVSWNAPGSPSYARNGLGLHSTLSEPEKHVRNWIENHSNF
jgi:hypothetical protein